MKLLRVLLGAVFLVAVVVAVADEDGPSASGFWQGDGQAIYPDGTFAEITLVQALLTQDGSFIHGEAEFTVTVGENDLDPQPGQISGYIRGNALKGVLGGCLPEAANCMGAGVFEGKLSGNKLTGTVMDLSDGSTSVITLYRMGY